MAKMKVIEAAVEVLKREGVDITFGVPGAAINPFYAAMKKSVALTMYWLATLKVLHTWLKAIHVPMIKISVCVLGLLALRARI